MLTQNTDSLRSVLNELNKKPGVFGPDTSRCRVLSILADISEEGEWQKFNNQLYSISKTNLEIVGERQPFKNIYKRYLAEGISAKALEFQLSNINDPRAIEYYNKSLDICLSINDQVGIGEIYNNLGSLYRDQGNLSKAISYLEQSYKTNERVGDKVGMASNLINLSVLSTEMGDTAKAFKEQERALRLFQEANHKPGIAISYNNLGDFYRMFGDFDKAERYLEIALKLNRECKDRNGEALALCNLASTYWRKKNTIKAIDFYNRSLNLYNETGSKLGISQVNQALSNAYYELDDLESALKHGLAGLKYSREAGIANEIMYSAGLLKKIYSETGKYKEALGMVDLYHQLNDSISRESFRKENIQREMQYKFDHKEKLMAMKKEEEKRLQRILFEQKQRYTVFAFTLILIIVATIFFYIYSRYKANKQKRELELTFRLKDSEIKALRAQMNPHFIFNSLGGVLELIRKAETQEAIKYLTKFSRLMRMILESSDKRVIPLTREIELMKLYIDLENFRFGKSFEYSIEIDQSLDTVAVAVPTLALQPFIENAILHGLRNKQLLSKETGSAFNGFLKVVVTQRGDMLVCMIEDNGVGRKRVEEIKNKTQYGHRSMGVEITKDRLDLFGHSQSKIEYTDLVTENGEASGTRVIVTFPLVSEF